MAQEFGERFAAGIAEAARLKQEKDLQKLVDLQIDIQSRLFDKSASYNNVVASLGYAGFLALWIWAREVIDPLDAKICGLLLGSSLFAFVIWTVLSNYAISKQNITMAKILSASDEGAAQKLQKIEQAESNMRRWMLKYYASWYFVFVWTFVTGFLAGAFLIGLIALDVAGSELGIHSIFESFQDVH